MSKRPAFANSGAFDWFDRLTNRLTNRLTSRRLVYFDKLSNRLSNHRHRVHASAYFVDHFREVKAHSGVKRLGRAFVVLTPIPTAATLELTPGTM
jgi:hypothetical protein